MNASSNCCGPHMVFSYVGAVNPECSDNRIHGLLPVAEFSIGVTCENITTTRKNAGPYLGYANSCYDCNMCSAIRITKSRNHRIEILSCYQLHWILRQMINHDRICWGASLIVFAVYKNRRKITTCVFYRTHNDNNFARKCITFSVQGNLDVHYSR